VRQLTSQRARRRRGATRHVVLAIVGACAIVLALTWWIERSRTVADANELAFTIDPNEPAESTSADLALAAHTPDERAPAVSILPVAAAASEPVAESDAIAREPVDVLVVERDTGERVAGAEVRWANLFEFDFAPDPRRPRWMPDSEELLAGARRARTDEHGIARIDARVFPGRVAVRKGDAFGWAHVNEASLRPVRVEIALARSIVIEVVDASGQPVAGAPVAVRKTPDRRNQGGLWTGTTDASGRASLGALAAELRSGSMFAAIDVLARDAPSVGFDVADPPVDPIRLVMPACGSVTVDVRDALGAPVLVDTIGIGLDNSDPADKARWGQVEFAPETIAEGTAHFPFVGIGLDLEIRARRQAQFLTRKVRGPRSVGKDVHVELMTGPALVVLAGRVVDESGLPLARRWMQFSSGGSPTGSWSRPIRTDPDGRFREVTPAQAGQPLRMTVSWTPLGTDAIAGNRAESVLDVIDPPSELELGDIVARATQHVASGIVVDDLGRPVTDAFLSVEVADASDKTWRADSRYSSGIGSEGRFAILAVGRPDRLRIRAVRRNLVRGAAFEIAIGERNVRILLPRASEIAGTVLLDAGFAPAQIEVRVTPVGGPDRLGQEGERMQSKLAVDGSFTLGGLQPGRVDVTFRANRQKAPLHTVAGVDLPPGGRATDGRLDAIDLRGQLPPPDEAGSAPKR